MKTSWSARAIIAFLLSSATAQIKSDGGKVDPSKASSSAELPNIQPPPSPPLPLGEMPRIPIPVSSASTVLPTPRLRSRGESPELVPHWQVRRQNSPPPSLPQIQPPPSPLLPLDEMPRIPIPVSTASTVIPSALNRPKADGYGVAYDERLELHAHNRRQNSPSPALPDISPPPSPPLPVSLMPKIPIPTSSASTIIPSPKPVSAAKAGR